MQILDCIISLLLDSHSLKGHQQGGNSQLAVCSRAGTAKGEVKIQKALNYKRTI